MAGWTLSQHNNTTTPHTHHKDKQPRLVDDTEKKKAASANCHIHIHTLYICTYILRTYYVTTAAVSSAPSDPSEYSVAVQYICIYVRIHVVE